MSKPTRIWWEVVNDGYGYEDEYPTVYIRGTEEKPYTEKQTNKMENWFEWKWQNIPETNKIMWLGEDKRVAEEERQRREKQERLRGAEEERRRQEREVAESAEQERQRLASERESDTPRIRDELTADANAVLRMNKDQIQEFFGFPRGELPEESRRKLQTVGKKMVQKFHPDKTSEFLGPAVASEFFSRLNIKLAVLALTPKEVLIGTGRKGSKKCPKCGLPKS